VFKETCDVVKCYRMKVKIDFGMTCRQKKEETINHSGSENITCFLIISSFLEGIEIETCEKSTLACSCGTVTLFLL